MKLLILDRDGVINKDSDAFVKNASEWIPITGSIDAIARLYKAGFTIVIATNQSGIGRGLFKLADLDAMHKKMHDLVYATGGKIEGIFFCPHHPDDNCQCRKPKTGLIDAIEKQLVVSARGAVLVGDSLRDLEAAIDKKCRPILVTTGKGKKTLEKIKAQANPKFNTLIVCTNLAEVADRLIKAPLK